MSNILREKNYNINKSILNDNPIDNLDLLHSNKNISFHHHLRNGDYVLNMVLDMYNKENVKELNLFPSAIFPSYTSILKLLTNNQIKDITTNYMNGPVAEFVSKN